jgi:hypothetical protein
LIRPLVVPDTGILLALGFGASVDPQASIATQAITKALAADSRLLAPPSVIEELDKKLAQLDQVYEAIQDIVRSIPSLDTTPSGLSGAEDLILGLKNVGRHPATRFVNAIETEVVRMITATPTVPLLSVFAFVASRTVLLKEAIRVGTRPAGLEILSEPKPDRSPLDPPIHGLKGDDLAHVRSCESIGGKLGQKVVFLVLDRPVYSQKRIVEARFPLVSVTNPNYIDSYLFADASVESEEGD